MFQLLGFVSQVIDNISLFGSVSFDNIYIVHEPSSVIVHVSLFAYGGWLFMAIDIYDQFGIFAFA